jgi:hypothetical protein
MSSVSPPNPNVSQIDDYPLLSHHAETYVVVVPRIDRWCVYHRLQELKIPCWCLADGTLRVEVQNSLGALLLRSVVQQFMASRQEMVHWLERCWQADEAAQF